MKFIIDPSGGMAGDMFSAALISAGADLKTMKQAMQAAAEKLGTAGIDITRTTDGSVRLKIQLNSSRSHLGDEEAGVYLNELYRQFRIEKEYRFFGNRILEILVRAEKKAHKDFKIVIHDHGQADHHHSPANLKPSSDHSHPEITFLHEAQDIIVDIIGAVTGLQSLRINPLATLSKPVSVGEGHIHFSHGTHGIPAPATRIILDSHRINWEKGPIEKELCTPTGASILAALGSRQILARKKTNNEKVSFRGKSRGSQPYDIPPLQIFLF